MTIVVFDTNVLVSAMIVAGKPQELWLQAQSGKFKLAESMQIVNEFICVMARKKFKNRFTENDVKLFLAALFQTARIVKVTSRIHVVEADPSDDIIVRTALDSNADYIVSGDKHLLALKKYRGIPIVTVDEMLKL